MMCYWRLILLATLLIQIVIGYEACLPSESGSARLSGLNSSYVGYIQVCKDGVWTAISFEEEDEWTKKNSIIACKELGFHGAIRIRSQNMYFPGTAASDIRGDPGQYYSLTCTGLEQHLADCAWSLKKVKAKKEDVMVLCREEPPDGDVAVVGVNGEDSEGIVLLYNPLKSYSWSSICATEWDDLDAEVACKQLGFKGGSSTSYSSKQIEDTQSLPTKQCSHFECLGSERELNGCPHLMSAFPSELCSTGSGYAGIICITETKDDGTLNMTIILLILMILITLLLIVILLLVLRGTLQRFRVKTSTNQGIRPSGSGTGRNQDGSRQMQIIRTQLDSEMPYSLTIDAPPSYDDTLLADRRVASSSGSQQEEATRSVEQEPLDGAVVSEDPLTNSESNNDEDMLIVNGVTDIV